MRCIMTKARPAEDAAAVKAAWDPADCREMCGKWPVLTGPGLVEVSAAKTNATDLVGFGRSDKKSCMESCANFQASLSSCVATILFEPGKVAAMGAPKETGSTAVVPAVCTQKDTPCMPDLELRHQKCSKHKTREVVHGVKADDAVKVQCKVTASDFDLCKDCPQLQDGYQSEYHAFTGGCMAQLNAYWQATHPSAVNASLPGASGCTVH